MSDIYFSFCSNLTYNRKHDYDVPFTGSCDLRFISKSPFTPIVTNNIYIVHVATNKL